MSKGIYKRKPRTEEQKKFHKKIMESLEVREKMRKAKLGKKQTPEQIAKRVAKIIGDKNPAWKGGIYRLNKAVRRIFKYRQWRSDVFTRDDFTCQDCGKRGGELHPDHIKQFAEILYENQIKTMQQALECEELWNINNGRTLCIPCHKKTETYGKKCKLKCWK
jgi:hypothetical protein